MTVYIHWNNNQPVKIYKSVQGVVTTDSYIRIAGKDGSTNSSANVFVPWCNVSEIVVIDNE